jgi:hypothetical protein
MSPGYIVVVVLVALPELFVSVQMIFAIDFDLQCLIAFNIDK